jgi:hypothetical protein
VRRPRLRSPNVVLFRHRSIRYFLAQNTLGLLPSSAYPTDPEYPLEKALWSAFPALKANRIKVYGRVNAGSTSALPINQTFLNRTPSFPTNLSSTRPSCALSAFRTLCKGITWTADSALLRCMASIIAGRQRKDGLACLPSKDLADKALHGFEACRQPYIEITFPG